MTADQGAREARYAQAIHATWCVDDESEHGSDVSDMRAAHSVIELVDAEVAAAVSEAQAEIERNATAAEAAIDHANLRRMTAESALRQVRQLHHVMSHPGSGSPRAWCNACGRTWPCPTTTLLDDSEDQS